MNNPKLSAMLHFLMQQMTPQPTTGAGAQIADDRFIIDQIRAGLHGSKNMGDPAAFQAQVDGVRSLIPRKMSDEEWKRYLTLATGMQFNAGPGRIMAGEQEPFGLQGGVSGGAGRQAPQLNSVGDRMVEPPVSGARKVIDYFRNFDWGSGG